MADERSEIRRIKWDEVFSFTHIFKTGWVALQPSKLLLAMAAILLLYGAGEAMGWLWGVCGQTARTDEINTYVMKNPAEFAAEQTDWRLSERRLAARRLAQNAGIERKQLQDILAAVGQAGPAAADEFRKRREEFLKDDKDKDSEFKIDNASDWSDLLADAVKNYAAVFDKASRILEKGDFDSDAVNAAMDAYAKSNPDAKGEQAEADKENARRKAIASAAGAWAALSKEKLRVNAEIRLIKGHDLFDSFLDYQGWCLQGMLRSTWRGNLLGGLDAYMALQQERSVAPLAEASPSKSDRLVKLQEPTQPECGLVYWLLMACQGVAWLFCRHWVFAAVFAVVALAVWALLGGALHRVCALSVTRGEKISIRQALRFSVGKFLSFFSAPLILLVVIFGLGLGLLTLGGLAFGNFAGGIVMAVFFPVALVVGLLMAFLAVGLVTGSGLMYPTIAVEGSDSFDGISRSFSYTFNRPSRSIFYGAVAVVFGSLCYLLLRLFLFVALKLTHAFIALGVIGNGASLGEGADRMDKLWTAPTFLDFHGPMSWAAMSGCEKVAAFIIAVWVNLVVVALGAYLLTYLASASTSIYCLLRNKVDATDLDEVYVEEADEDQPAPAVETPAPPPTPPPQA
ncbi:MAG: hypothetical protein NT031_01500, partial [Planctomycetota bacterium]|nr:hypothetical protein [Planctomycetota bacterium]